MVLVPWDGDLSELFGLSCVSSFGISLLGIESILGSEKTNIYEMIYLNQIKKQLL